MSEVRYLQITAEFIPFAQKILFGINFTLRAFIQYKNFWQKIIFF